MQTWTVAEAKTRLTELGFVQDRTTAAWKHADGREGRLGWLPDDYRNPTPNIGQAFFLTKPWHGGFIEFGMGNAPS